MIIKQKLDSLELSVIYSFRNSIFQNYYTGLTPNLPIVETT